MRILFDLDNTLCKTEGEDYPNALPLLKRIKTVNALKADGHHITIATARGWGSGIDWRPLTESQLEEWGLEYDELIIPKPFYDLMVDDRNRDPEGFFLYGDGGVFRGLDHRVHLRLFKGPEGYSFQQVGERQLTVEDIIRWCAVLIGQVSAAAIYGGKDPTETVAENVAQVRAEAHNVVDHIMAGDLAQQFSWIGE